MLEGKVVVVTGAGGGIGRDFALAMAAKGAKVVVNDVGASVAGEGRDAGPAQRVVEEIRSRGGTAVANTDSVAEWESANRIIQTALDAFGRVDVVVNNAGILDDAPFLDLPVAEFDRILGVNLRGAFLMGQAAARQMVKQGTPAGAQQAGAIVNMSSINERFALPDHVAYSISKGGISQLTKAMAIALAPHGIRVNAVGPGTIETPLLEGVIKDKAFREKVLSRTPIGRFGRPAEIAAIVAWLASEESSYVTGTTIFADGGRLPLNYVVPVRE